MELGYGALPHVAKRGSVGFRFRPEINSQLCRGRCGGLRLRSASLISRVLGRPRVAFFGLLCSLMKSSSNLFKGLFSWQRHSFNAISLKIGSIKRYCLFWSMNCILSFDGDTLAFRWRFAVFGGAPSLRGGRGWRFQAPSPRSPPASEPPPRHLPAFDASGRRRA